MRRKVLGENHPDTAASLHNLGRLLYLSGDYAAARLPMEQALAVYARVPNADPRTKSRCLDGMGSILTSQGDYVAARAYYEQALAIRLKAFGGRRLRHGRIPTKLGGLAGQTGGFRRGPKLPRAGADQLEGGLRVRQPG